MAETPRPDLQFTGGCPDCGERRVDLPPPFPAIPDDFDWNARDYDSFRLFLMEELASRAPERRRWTAADMEVVLVEALAAALDRLSHALDSIQQERFIETARRPESVRRLLKLIGYDAVAQTDPDVLAAVPPAPPDEGPDTPERQLERYWRLDPEAMEAARKAGPASIREQKRMVSLDDYASGLESHPLVARAQARSVWSGAWHSIRLSVLLEKDLSLESGTDEIPADLAAATEDFHQDRSLPVPAPDAGLTVRDILAAFLEAYRMAGQPVVLEEAKQVGITFSLSVQVRSTFYRSEVLYALRQRYGTEAGGFFEPGALRFGEDLYASDLIEVAYDVEGVETVCLNRFKRVGKRFPDRTDEAQIEIAPDEIAVCKNESTQPASGYFRIVTHGGIPG